MNVTSELGTIGGLIRLARFLLLAWSVGIGSQMPVSALEWNQTAVAIKADVSDKKAEAKYVFKNVGSRPVTITQISSSCGCTVATVDRKTYLQGESGTIQATFVFGDRTGSQHKLVTVTTDEPDTKPYALTLEVDIPKLVQFSPLFVSWQRQDSPLPKTITVRLLRPELVSVESLEAEDPGFKVRLRQDDADPHVYYVLVHPASTEQRGSSRILLHLNRQGGEHEPVVMHVVVTERAIGKEIVQPE